METNSNESEITLCESDVVLKNSNSNNKTSDNLSEVDIKIESLFTCPVCLDSVLPPIEQCANGHIICRYCRTSVSRCPVCRHDYFEFKIRALVLEAHADIIGRQFSCSTCTTTPQSSCLMTLRELANHKEHCDSRTLPRHKRNSICWPQCYAPEQFSLRNIVLRLRLRKSQTWITDKTNRVVVVGMGVASGGRERLSTKSIEELKGQAQDVQALLDSLPPVPSPFPLEWADSSYRQCVHHRLKEFTRYIGLDFTDRQIVAAEEEMLAFADNAAHYLKYIENFCNTLFESC